MKEFDETLAKSNERQRIVVCNGGLGYDVREWVRSKVYFTRQSVDEIVLAERLERTKRRERERERDRQTDRQTDKNTHAGTEISVLRALLVWSITVQILQWFNIFTSVFVGMHYSISFPIRVFVHCWKARLHNHTTVWADSRFLLNVTQQFHFCIFHKQIIYTPIIFALCSWVVRPGLRFA